MGFFTDLLDVVLTGMVVIGGAIGVVVLALFGAFIQALPFLIKIGALAILAYFGLGLFGII